MNRKPLVGFTAPRFFVASEKMTGMPRTMLNEDYTKAIQKAGGLPLIIPPVCSEEEIAQYVALCDGVVATGGWDISPITYGAAPSVHLCETDYDVDRTHLGIIKGILKANKPILGICRGTQLMNIAQGGTLYQDILTEAPSATHGHSFTHIRWDPVHAIQVIQGTPFYDFFGKEKVMVNSIHHQAIKELGENVVVCANAEDGIIEAICIEGKKFAIGTQWHPEMLLNRNNEMFVIFEKFIAACK